MKPGLLKFFKSVYFERDKTDRNKLKVFLTCLGFSIIIWFLIVLSKESTTTLEYPVVFKNLPTGLMLVNSPDTVLSFRIASGGLELFTLKYLTRKRPVVVDVSNLNLQKQGIYFTSSYPTSQLSASVLKRVNFLEELVSISPELILFRFESVSGKKVPVKPNLNLTFEQQYRLSDSIKLIPDSVIVSGPEHLIEKVGFIETELTEIQTIKEQVIGSATLQNPDKSGKIKLSRESVDVIINSEKYTESSIVLKLNATNSELKVKTFPAEVTVTFLVSLRDFKRIDPAMFQAVIDLTDKGYDNKLHVKIMEYPSFIDITRIEPEKVEYLVLKQ
ncbi:MAG: hypothetical protein K8S16_01055 [Bacteroidales bacterium]|nr:hypothetical protein [Bacteroidales bacterium]